MTDSARSFPPMEGATAHTLILGTAPGQESLSAAQYYAHPRNAFWPIMLAIINSSTATFESVKHLDYDQRCQLLIDHGYAIWDVLASCDRPGSLDSRIVRSSEIPNDIEALVTRHPELRTIACNGKTAQKLFARHIRLLSEPLAASKNSNSHDNANINSADHPRLCCLPSSSPAMASLNLDQKHQLWAEGLLG